MESGHRTDKDRFLAVFKINVLVFIIEVLAGWQSESLSMISDGFHVSLHIVVSLIALMSEYRFGGFEPSKIKLWSAGVNIALFFPLAGLISYEAYQRLNNPPTQNLSLMFFLVAFLVLVANIYTIVVLHRGSNKQRSNNEAPRGKAARYLRNSSKPLTPLRQGYAGFSSPSSPQQATEYSAKENKNRPLLLIHMIFDAIGSIIVIIGGIAIHKTGSNLIDPKLSFVLSGLIVAGALWMSWGLFRSHNH